MIRVRRIQFLAAPPHEWSDLSDHYSVCAVVVRWLATLCNFLISLDFKNSKTKMCFRPFWATIILDNSPLPLPPPLAPAENETTPYSARYELKQKHFVQKIFCHRISIFLNQNVFQEDVNEWLSTPICPSVCLKLFSLSIYVAKYLGINLAIYGICIRLSGHCCLYLIVNLSSYLYHRIK